MELQDCAMESLGSVGDERGIDGSGTVCRWEGPAGRIVWGVSLNPFDLLSQRDGAAEV